MHFSSVRKGVEFSNQERYEDAIKCYNEALNMDSKNVDAMVARGAALANLKEFERAINQLEMALSIDSQHSNAKKYLEIIEQKLQAERNALNPSKEKSKKNKSAEDVYAILKKKHKNKDKKSKKKRKSSTKDKDRDSSDRGRSEIRKNKKDSRKDKTLSPPSVQQRQKSRYRSTSGETDEPPLKRSKIK